MPLAGQEQNQNYFNSPQARTNSILRTSAPAVKPSNRIPGVRTRKETLDDLEQDDRFQQDADLFLDFLGTNDDIFETLRDTDYNIVKGLMTAAEAGSWPEEVKQAYGRLRTRFDNADTGSFNQYLEAFKDIGIDVITDPTLLAGFVAAPFTGGASLGARQVASQAVREGAKRYALTKAGVATGAMWSGVDNFARQKIAQEVGLQDDVSGAQVLAAGVIGGAIGGGVGFLAGDLGRKIADDRAANRALRVLDETRIEERLAYDKASPGIFALRPIAKATSILGKPAGILSPLVKKSSTARKLQQQFRSDLGRGISNPIAPTARGTAGQDFGQLYADLVGKRFTKIKKIIEPISFNRSGKLDKDVNDALVLALRGGDPDDLAIRRAAFQIRQVYDEMFNDLADAGLLSRETVVRRPPGGYEKWVYSVNGDDVLTKKAAEFVDAAEAQGLDPFDDALMEVRIPRKVENYFKRKWNRKAIERNPEELKRLFVEDGQAPDAVDAQRIVDELLDKENQLSSSAAEVFNVSRVFDKIDDTKYAEFLDNDFNEVTFDYITQSMRRLAGVQTFGVKSLREFQDTTIEQIAKEVSEAGGTLTRKERQEIADLYKFATGEGIRSPEGAWGFAKDATALAFQVSMLPLATLSSLTEVLIPLTRQSVPGYLKSFSQGMSAGFKKISIDMLDTLRVKHNMTRPQVFNELNRFMLALDQSSADTIERLSGQNIRNSTMRRAQNTFFKANLLTQWTDTVKATAFISGKDIIRRNLRRLSRMNDLNSRGAIRLRNELADLGVDFQEGIRWFNNGAREGDAFYENVQRGAASFVNDVILNTSREAGVKPHIMANPMTDIFFQFMSYPAAFTNVVLKNMGQEMIENPIRGGTKVLSTAALMTTVARFGNYVRSNGESEEGVSEWEAWQNGLIRWGGNGLVFDMMMRAKEATERSNTVIGGAAGVFGPLIGEGINSILYRRGPSQILGTKTPGFGAKITPFGFGQEAMDDYTTWLREQDKKLHSMLIGKETGSPANR